jgi:hypothetical protein
MATADEHVAEEKLTTAAEGVKDDKLMTSTEHVQNIKLTTFEECKMFLRRLKEDVDTAVIELQMLGKN